MSAPFAQSLLDWYDQRAAALPWRSTHEVYRIWLSEVMLQQTQVETVIPYYDRFLTAFPTLEALAAAPLDAVLKLWEGLGYYSRARNLHKAAQVVVNQYQGVFPATAEGLQALPGIGRYTAGAIASIAYGEITPVLDGNVIRVFARLTDLEADVTQGTVKDDLWALAARWMPSERPGDYNQALMELGRTVCKPRNPLCETCPIHAHCAAFEHGTQTERPVKKPRAVSPHYDVTAGLIWNDQGKLLIAQRPAEGLLGGLWEFPGGKVEAGESLPACLQRELREELAIEVEVGQLFTVVRHAFTHFKITLHAFTCRYVAGPPQTLGVQAWAWVKPDALAAYSFGKADRDVIQALHNRGGMLF
ncbi:MAG: A/G-specific adenine glycosylase [Anaerolineaceae bacterium]|nr:A/G-specific adenine glycosylase [Anaerolineaceae bacterium]